MNLTQVVVKYFRFIIVCQLNFYIAIILYDHYDFHRLGPISGSGRQLLRRAVF